MGRGIPSEATLALPRDADRRSWSEARATSGEDSEPGLVAAPCARTASSVLRVVEEAGWARFRARVARLEGDLSAVDPDQVVWRGVAEALGYSRNTAAFGRLADAVPWSDAAEAVAW